MLNAENVPYCPYCDKPMTQITKNLTGESFGCEQCANETTTFLHHAPKQIKRIETLAGMVPVAEIKTPKP